MKDPSGSPTYGLFWNGEKTVLAHRWAYLHAVGSLPDELDHIVCDRPECVNWEHLAPSTHRSNWERSSCPSNLNRLKDQCKWGHPLTEDNVYTYLQNGRAVRKCKACVARRRQEAMKRDPDGVRERNARRMRKKRAR